MAKMPEASADLIDHFPAFLARFPGKLELEGLSRQTKAFQRRRGVRSGTDLFRLALAWGSGGYSRQHVAAWAGERGIATLTQEALIQRLHGAGEFLEAVTGQLLARVGAAPAWHGRVLRIGDSTSLSKPASKGTDWRVHCVYDLGVGGFTPLEVTDKHGGEALDRGKPVAGEIRMADRGFANAQSWQRFLQARQQPEEQNDFIVRMRWNTIRLIDQAGELFDIIAWLKTRPCDSDTYEITASARSGKHQRPMQIRLIARRKPPEAIEATHKHLRQQASRKPTRIDPRSLIAAEYLVLATSLPAEDLPSGEVLAAYRLRWQIELAIKRLKSLMKVGEIRTRTEVGTRCWLHAKLIVALLCDHLSQDFLESFPSAAFRPRRSQFAVAGDRGRAARTHSRDRSRDHDHHARTA